MAGRGAFVAIYFAVMTSGSADAEGRRDAADALLRYVAAGRRDATPDFGRTIRN